MERTLIRHPKLTVREITGREGPAWDPYHYRELAVDTPAGSIVVHDGLARYVDVNGERMTATGDDYEDPLWGDDIVAAVAGFTPKQLERIHRKKVARCPMGGYHLTYSESGYPGEEFEVCSKCGKVVESSFDINAVM